MRKSKLFETIERLSLGERRGFLATLDLKENNLSANDQKIARLFVEKIVSRRIPKGEEAFWKDNGVSKAAANKIKSRLLRALERYLILGAIDKEPRLKHILMASKYAALGLEKQLFHHLRKLEKNTRPDQLIDPYLGEYLKQEYLYYITPERELMKPDAILPQLDVQEKAFVRFKDYTEIRILLAQLGFRKLHRVEGSTADEIRMKIQAIVDQSEDKVIQLFGRLVRLLDQCPPEEYFELSKAFEQIDEEVPEEYLKNQLMHQTNYCIYRSRYHNDVRFSAEFIKVLNRREQKGFHLHDQYTVKKATVNNCIAHAVISGQLEWSEGFLERNWDKLSEHSGPERKAYRKFALAYIAINRGQLSEAQSYMHAYQQSSLYSKTDMHGFIQRIAAEKILSKVYFEQGELKALKLQIRKVRGEVNRSPYPEVTKTRLLQFFDTLMECSENGQPLTAEQIEGWPLVDQVWGKRMLQ